MDNVFVGRQPIFDREQNVFAYELLFRDRSASTGSGLEGPNRSNTGDAATARVIVNTFTEIGLERIVGNSRAFLNLTKSFIIQRNLLGLPADRVVLEILEDVEIDDGVIRAVRRLKQEGYLIALDDFEFDESWRPLLLLADIVKLDIRSLSPAEIRRHVELLKPFGVKLLAEKIETPAEAQAFEELGFDYFQGYYFSKPNIISGQKMPANRASVLNLLGEIQSPETSVDRLEKIIAADVSLSYKLLLHLNSASFALSQKLDSIRSAIVYLGDNQIRNWATLLTLAGIEGKPNELTISSLTRARMCQLLAVQNGHNPADQFFTVGLFSTLDAMMDMEFAVLLQSLPLCSEVKSALLHFAGLPGRYLKCVLYYEQGEWEMLNAEIAILENLEITSIYLESIGWARERAAGLL